MVEMALAKLNENDIVQLDEERKAAMVSNLPVILCGNRDAQPNQQRISVLIKKKRDIDRWQKR